MGCLSVGTPDAAHSLFMKGSTTAMTPLSQASSTSETGSVPAATWRARYGRAALPYLLILPTFLFIATFTLWPSFSAIINSTIKPAPTVRQQPRFVGLQNYIDLFDSNKDIGQTFPQVLRNTLVFVAVTVPISIVLAFVLALMLNRKMRAIGFFRFAFFYPVLMPLIGAASIFAFIYADNIGLANTVLRSLGMNTPPKWIGDPFWTPLAIMIVALWKQTGFYMILYLAGLQALPGDVYEAADLDGATWWVKIRRLTIPLMSGTTVFVLTTAAANAFQMVDQLYALGEGAPADRSNLILYYIYQKYNEPANQGYVNAITVILLLMLLSVTIFNLRVIDRRAYYEN
jgi:sn-glycerol 3-phosphate transport system permease protein